MDAKIWLLYHSGFAVDIGSHFLIFDYWRDTPKGGGLSDGVIDPKELAGRDVIIFASHIHGDHYTKKILSLGREIPKCRLVLSDDIPKTDGAFMIGPNQTLTQPDFSLTTFRSNDEGVAFLLEIGGKRIYHAGDLNWWHWEGEPDDWNAEMADIYREQISLLCGKTIDLAFQPVDPRLEEQYAWGVDYLMKNADVRYVVPMHFADDASVVGRLLRDPVSEGFREKVIGLTERGQSAKIRL